MPVRRRRKKGWRVSDCALLWVIFKWHHGSERVNLKRLYSTMLLQLPWPGQGKTAPLSLKCCSIEDCRIFESWHRTRTLTLESQKVITGKRSHKMDGWPLHTGLCACLEISAESKFGADLAEMLWNAEMLWMSLRTEVSLCPLFPGRKNWVQYSCWRACSPCQSLVDYRITDITQHALVTYDNNGHL